MLWTPIENLCLECCRPNFWWTRPGYSGNNKWIRMVGVAYCSLVGECSTRAMHVNQWYTALHVLCTRMGSLYVFSTWISALHVLYTWMGGTLLYTCCAREWVLYMCVNMSKNSFSHALRVKKNNNEQLVERVQNIDWPRWEPRPLFWSNNYFSCKILTKLCTNFIQTPPTSVWRSRFPAVLSAFVLGLKRIAVRYVVFLFDIREILYFWLNFELKLNFFSNFPVNLTF